MLWRLRRRIYVLILDLGKIFAPVDQNIYFIFNFQAELQSFCEKLKHLNTLEFMCYTRFVEDIFTCILVQILIVVFSGRIL
jgi:hypothetical protein